MYQPYAEYFEPKEWRAFAKWMAKKHRERVPPLIKITDEYLYVSDVDAGPFGRSKHYYFEISTPDLSRSKMFYHVNGHKQYVRASILDWGESKLLTREWLSNTDLPVARNSWFVKEFFNERHSKYDEAMYEKQERERKNRDIIRQFNSNVYRDRDNHAYVFAPKEKDALIKECMGIAIDRARAAHNRPGFKRTTLEHKMKREFDKLYEVAMNPKKCESCGDPLPIIRRTTKGGNYYRVGVTIARSNKKRCDKCERLRISMIQSSQSNRQSEEFFSAIRMADAVTQLANQEEQ